MEKIDFVITWVDGSDPVWLAERAKYVSDSDTKRKDVAGSARYHDNGLLQYLFRGIEKFTPWVNKVHFVTYGHLPAWLNTGCEKLRVVNHRDFLPENALPTFSSVPLNLNLHRIPGIADRFVYFNDDMFLVSPCGPEVFFKDGLPCDMAVMDVIPATENTAYWHMVYNDTIMLNANYNKKESIKAHKRKWYSHEYRKNTVKNLLLAPFAFFPGIYETHLPASYLKSAYEKAWEDNFDTLSAVTQHKVRSNDDVSENFIRYCQLASGDFAPLNKLKTGRFCNMASKALPGFITSGRYKYLCINNEVEGEPFERTKAAFESILPEKSGFEI